MRSLSSFCVEIKMGLTTSVIWRRLTFVSTCRDMRTMAGASDGWVMSAWTVR